LIRGGNLIHINRGNPSKIVEVQVAFSNDHYKDYIPVATAFIENYKPHAKNEFRGWAVVKTGAGTSRHGVLSIILRLNAWNKYPGPEDPTLVAP